MTTRTTSLTIVLAGVILACATLHAATTDVEALMKQMREFEKAGAPAKARETANQIVAMTGATPWNGPWIRVNYAIFRPAN